MSLLLPYFWYYDTEVLEKRQRTIAAWLKTLSDTEQDYILELLRDQRDQTEYETHCYSCTCYE